MLAWGKFLASLAAIVSWFQEQFRLSQARQDGRNEKDVETLEKIVEGKAARDLVDTDKQYADKLLLELGLGSRDETANPADDGQLLSELRTRVLDGRNSGSRKSWRIEKLFNIPTAVYRYNKTSLGKLSTCHGELQLIGLELTKELDGTVICGTRSNADQQEAYDSGASKVKPGNSKHNSLPSNAIDIVPASAPRLWAQGKDLPFAEYKAFKDKVFAIAAKYGIKLRWGGDWDGDGDSTDQTFMDFAHFERLD